MKKIVIFSTIMLIIMGLITNVYAESSCTVISSINNSEVKKNDEVIVTFAISKIEDDIGIFMLGATLNYDKNALELKKIEPLGGWSGLLYNDTNGSFVIDRDYTKQPGNIIKATFKAIGETEKNTSISLSNICASNGIEDLKTSQSTAVNVMIKPIVIEPGEENKPTPIEPPVEEPKPEQKPNETTTTETTKPNEENNTNLKNETNKEKPAQNLAVGTVTDKTETNTKNKPNKTNTVETSKKNETSEIIGTTTESNPTNENVKNEAIITENNESILKPIENHETIEDSNRTFIIIGAVTATIILAEIIFFVRKINIKKKQIKENAEIITENYDNILEDNKESYERYEVGASASYSMEMKNDNYITPAGYARVKYMPEIKNRDMSMQNYYSQMLQNNNKIQ